jgi:hypothetical protein
MDLEEKEVLLIRLKMLDANIRALRDCSPEVV